MLSHVHIGITNFEPAFAFYRGVMDELGFTLKFSEPENRWRAGCRPASTGHFSLSAIRTTVSARLRVMDKWWPYSLRLEMLWTGATPEPSPMADEAKANPV
jgi:hypothetical protein